MEESTKIELRNQLADTIGRAIPQSPLLPEQRSLHRRMADRVLADPYLLAALCAAVER